MRHDLYYHCIIVLKNDKEYIISGAILDRIIKKPFNDAYEEITKHVKVFLINKNITHNNLKEVDIKIEYKEEIVKTDEEYFFHDLLDKTKSVFKHTDVYKKYGENNNWNYAICDTPIQRGKGVFFGLNWGSKDKNAQTEFPEKNKKRNWKFVSYSRKYFRDYLGQEIENLNYSNLCFFRSPKAYQISNDDWDKGIGLFNEYVNYIKPPWTIMLGSPPKQLRKYHLTDLVTIEVRDEKYDKVVKGYTGKLFCRYPFVCVPHPVARISKEARNQIWEKVVKNIKL